jgi:hypothetical protein
LLRARFALAMTSAPTMPPRTPADSRTMARVPG